jgi:hypothetical protein
MELTTDLLTVICGKKYIYDKWFYSIKKLVQTYKFNQWIVVNNASSEFIQRIQLDFASHQLNKYTKLRIIEGPGKFVPPNGMNWRSPEVCIGKHKSTGASFTLGFVASNADLVLTIDDDIVCKPEDFSKLLNFMKVNHDIAGCIGGLYFNHMGWNSDNPWRTRSQLKRTVVASIEKNHWYPAMIDDYWNRGVVESGFIGTGFTLYNNRYVRLCLPMQTFRNHEKGTIMGPDGHLCQQLRTQYNLQTYVDSTILCEHHESENKEAGLGASKFLSSVDLTESIVLCGSFKRYELRRKNYLIAKKISEQNNLNLVVAWIDDIDKKCDFVSETDVVLNLDYDKEKKDFHKIKNEYRVKQKILDEIYFRTLNAGKNILNFMETTDKVVSFTKIVNMSKNKSIISRIER